MVLFNYATRELTAKIVYYGPGLCGKTTNLEYIHKSLPDKSRGKMLSLATQTDRTLFFDFLPIDLGSVKGMKTRVQLYTVPGQVFYDATRKLVLKGADGVVFVADSQREMFESNLESWENLKTNLEENGLDIKTIPIVIQFNKRDLPNVIPIKEINQKFNHLGAPYFEAVALSGKGVQETLKGIAKVVLESLSQKYTKEGKEAKEAKDASDAKHAKEVKEAEAKSPLADLLEDAEELVEDLPGPGPALSPEPIEVFDELEEFQEMKAEPKKPAPVAPPPAAAPHPKPKKSVEKTMEVKKSDLPPEAFEPPVARHEPPPKREKVESPAVVAREQEVLVSVSASSSSSDVRVPIEINVGKGEQTVRLQLSIDLKIRIIP